MYMRCFWCGRHLHNPCVDISIIEDSAILGDDECYAELATLQSKQEMPNLVLRYKIQELNSH